MSARRLSLMLIAFGLATGAGSMAPGLQAQQPVQLPFPPGQPGVPIFRTSTRLVVHAVTVRDRNGNPIEGLTPQDFVVTENGRPQEVAFALYQQIASEPLPPLDVAQLPAVPAPADTGVAPLVQPQIAVPSGGGVAYQDKRLLVLYFDGVRLEDTPRAYQGALDYIDRHMGRSDLVAIMVHARGSLRVRHDFTDDRLALRDTLLRMMYADPRDVDDLDMFFGESSGEFTLFNNDMRLAALQRAMEMLGALPERKTLLYLTSGLQRPGVDNIAQFQATMNAAVRANVTINPLHARGLEAVAPVGSAAMRSPGGTGIFTGQAMLSTMAGFQSRQDTLVALADGTGGVALVDYNDLSAGVVMAADRVTSYYILGYYTTNTQADGRQRQVRVALAGGREADLAYRESYFAERAFADMNTIEREQHLRASFAVQDPITEITLAMEVNYFQLNRAEYFVPVAVKIPGNELAIVRRRGAARTQFIFMGEVRDEFGTVMTNIRDELPIRLDTQTAEELASRPVQYDTGFTLLPGNYAIKLLVRDEETGRVGTYLGSFSIPNLNREPRLPISSVVLSSQRVALDEAIFSVRERLRGTQEASPLVQDGQKLLPSVTRVFSAARDMYVYVEAYQREVEEMQPLVAYVTFYREHEKVFETAPVAVTGGRNERRAVPVGFSVPLSSLEPGLYDVQVSVLEPGGGRANFWRSRVALVR